MKMRNTLALGMATGAGLLWGARQWLRSQRNIDLAGRVVIITGGTSGHGMIAARLAARRGARLVLVARSTDVLHQAVDDLRDHGAADVIGIPTDITVPEQVQAMVSQTLEHFGRIDVLINNAGIITVGPMEHVTLEQIHEVMAANFWGAVHCTLAVLPQMRQQQFGRIGNVVSVGGKMAVPHLLPYTASKFALSGWTKGLRAELARDNILVTGIYPSTMRTGGHTHASFQGNRQLEYLWFALGDSIPLLSTSAWNVAEQLWDAVCHGDPEVHVGWQSKMYFVTEALFPNWTSEVFSLVNRVLPPPAGGGSEPVQGQDLGGQVPRVLNEAVPRAARPH